MTRSRRAQEIANLQGAIPRNSIPPFMDIIEDEHGLATGGGETSAEHMLTFEERPGTYYSPLDDAPVDRLRGMTINNGPPSIHSTGTVAETLTRLQIDMVKRNVEELNKVKDTMREEMHLAMREMQAQIREMIRPAQVEQRQVNPPQVRLASSYESSRRRNVESRRSDQYPRSDSNRQRESFLKIDKWGIKFDGDSAKMSVDDFIFRVEHLKNYHGVSWSEVLGDFHKLLGQKASEWYWIQVRMTGIPDWPTLRAALRRTYSSRLTNFELERELMERTQKPGEFIDDYIHEMCRLRSQLRTPIDEAEMVRVLKRNVKESVGRILFSMNISSVEKLRAEYHSVERAFSNRNYRPNPPLQAPRNYGRPQISEVRYDDDFDTIVEEVHGDHVTCWNCHETML